MRRFFIPIGLAVAAIYILRVLFGSSGEAEISSAIHAEVTQRPAPASIPSTPAAKETAISEASTTEAKIAKADYDMPTKAEPRPETEEYRKQQHRKWKHPNNLISPESKRRPPARLVQNERPLAG